MRPSPRRIARASLAVLLLGVVTALCLEVALRIAEGVGVARLRKRATEPHPFYEDANPRFGVWHPANASYRATKSCFDIGATRGARAIGNARSIATCRAWSCWEIPSSRAWVSMLNTA